jgi:hypothetical protein
MSSIKSKNSDGSINIANGETLYYSGKIAQVIQTRSDEHITYSSPNSGNGTTVSALAMTISPKFSNSLLVITFMINGEMHQDNVFLMHRNNALITDASYQGYNNAVGNIRTSGIASAFYDQNEDSTPSNWCLQYFVASVNTTSRTYAPAVRSSSSGNYTFALNRTLNAASQAAYERMVSIGTIMEITQ